MLRKYWQRLVMVAIRFDYVVTNDVVLVMVNAAVLRQASNAVECCTDLLVIEALRLVGGCIA
jgi:hypothetical protein